MITTMIVIALALCAVTLFYIAARSRNKQSTQPVRPADVQALRTLLDRDDELFLRERLARFRFWRPKRQRILVSLRYAGRIPGNSCFVMRFGAATVLNPQP